MNLVSSENSYTFDSGWDEDSVEGAGEGLFGLVGMQQGAGAERGARAGGWPWLLSALASSAWAVKLRSNIANSVIS